jgi:translation initiation factor IF-3
MRGLLRVAASQRKGQPAGHRPLSVQGRGYRRSQGGHISVEPRINERIRVPEVRLVGPAGEQVGIVSINDALRLAQEADLDLVEVAPTARPPVAKLMDYGKYKYESALKARESRKNQAQTVIKEIKLRPKIDPHDYGTKKSHVERFLRQGDKVKVTIMFRGREQSRPELGFRLLQRLAGDVEELGFVESQPRQDGRNMIMVIGPHRRKSEARAERATRDAHHGERPISRSRAAVAVAANAVAAEAEAVEADRDEQSPDAAQAAARPQPAASASAVGRGSAPKAAAEG